MSPSKRKGLLFHPVNNKHTGRTIILNTIVLSSFLIIGIPTTRYYYHLSHFKFSNAPIRIFGPSSKTSRIIVQQSKVFHQIFGETDRLWYMQEYGVSRCGLESLEESYIRKSP